MEDIKLTISIPGPSFLQLVNISKNVYGIGPSNLASFWVIDKLNSSVLPQGSIHDLGVPNQQNRGRSVESPISFHEANTTRKKIRYVIEKTWEFGDSFSRKELVRAVQAEGNFPEVDQNVILPADRAINQVSGYHRKHGFWVKQEPYLFKRPDGKFERYDVNIHGDWECIEDEEGHKNIWPKNDKEIDNPQIP